MTAWPSMSDTDGILARAVAAHRAGLLDEAENGYRQVLKGHPKQPDALHLLGSVLLAKGRPQEAQRQVAKAIAQIPAHPAFHNTMGLILRALGQPAEAVASYRKAISLAPDYLDARLNLGNLLRGQGELTQALATLSEAASRNPKHPGARYSHGIVLHACGRYAQAVGELEAALISAPGHVPARLALGRSLLACGETDKARACFDEVIALQPGHAPAYAGRADVLREAGHLAEALADLRRAAELQPDNAALQSDLLLTMNYDPGLSLAQIAEAHAAWGKRFSASRPGRARRRSGPLRIGYVSPDFYYHPVGYFLLPVLKGHGAVETFCYSDRSREDDMTEALKSAAGTWRRIVGMSDEALAGMIAADRIDILVDLAGHTAGNRLGVFARKPAPVQISWLGYFNTTGLPEMDAILMDPVAVRAGEEALFTEQIIRLPGGRFCYAPPAHAPEIAALPALSAGFVTFGSFNNLTKITDSVIALWSRVLKAVPDSRLVLKWRNLGSESGAESMRQRFKAQGIDPQRLDLRGQSPHTAMLAEYGEIDIALDPFPFNGGLTSCEALWMGVPVVTLDGATPVARQTAGYLTVLDLTNLIAADMDAYVQIAGALAADLPRLADLRSGMRGRMAGSPLCDGIAFARALEKSYAELAQSAGIR